MQKMMKKIAKFLLLAMVIFSDLMTPIRVLAEEISNSDPVKGDIGSNGVVSDEGSVTVSTGSLDNEGDVLVTKTVSKTDVEGKYNVTFNIKGKDVTSSTEITKPVYAVVVFDRSGSMEKNERQCVRYWNNGICREWQQKEVKFSAAVEGAKIFADTLLEKIPTANIALVTFATNATIARGFAGTNLDSANFGEPNGGTNLHAGLIEANRLLSSSDIPEEANKYVVVISDGQPTYYLNSKNEVSGPGSRTTKEVLDATYGEANSIKETAEMFAIGYSLPTENVYDDTRDGNVYGRLTAKDILKSVASADTAEDIQNGVTHYMDADPEAVANAFTNIASVIGKNSAGTDAVLTDNIGGAFTIVGQDGNSYVSNTIKEITEEGTIISFDITVDKDSTTGWYNTNEGFKLEYTDAFGEKQTITCDENPEVYWVQNEYDYIVNYYKDSITDGNLIASDTRKAFNNTRIDITNVEKDKYLPTGYEFNLLNPEFIVVTNDGSTKVIDVLYTIKKFNYVVNYYYDGEIDSTKNITDVPYGTKVESPSYYLSDSEIREGYILDTSNSDTATYTITDNEVVINIYYKKDSYSYNVNYRFDNVINPDFTKNENALYGTTVNASDNYLTETELGDTYKDYFLDPDMLSNYGSITVGTGENILNLYYITTLCTGESIDKTTSTSLITSSNDSALYNVKYSSTSINVRGGDTVVVTIVDTLPYAIDEVKSNLNGGTYDETTKTITWVFTETVESFTREYNVNKEVSYSVQYKDFAGVSSLDNNTLVNTARGTTTVSGKTTIGVEDTAIVPVEIKGIVKVNYTDLAGNKLADEVVTEDLVGKNYTTNAKDIYGYTLDHIDGEANGTYIDGVINVTYVYRNNDGNVVINDLVKTQVNTITDINSEFDYTLGYTGKIEDFVGESTLTLTDTLPYEVKEIVSMDNRCTFDITSNKITCSDTYTLDEDNDTINDTFNVVVKYNDALKTVTNVVESNLVYGNNNVTDSAEVTDTIPNGNVTSIYVDEENNELAGSESSTDLVGKEYTTTAKDIYGYTLVEIPSNKDGNYTKEDITVKYVYSKNPGTVTENEVVKEGPEKVTNVNGAFDYTLKYTGAIDEFVGKVTLKLTDTLPYEIDTKKSSIDNRCVYTGKTIICTETYDIDENNKKIDAEFDLSLVFADVTDEKVVNKVNSELIYDNNTETDEDETETIVEKGTVVATYTSVDGEVLHEDVTSTELAGKEYDTETKEFYGYTLKEVPSNKEGTYLANQTITVNYVYTKNVGSSEEELVKDGATVVDSINSGFDYTITYHTTINDYVGEVKLVITDILPYEIDTEKSVFSDNCVYLEGKIICTYDSLYVTEDNREISVVEKFVIYYLGVNDKNVTNKVESNLVYGVSSKDNNDEHTTSVKEGKVNVHYVLDNNGEYIKLTDSISFTGLVGESYVTNSRDFDDYYLVKVIGDKTGTITEGETDVTYVYSLIPLPPQTGVEMPNFINYLLIAIAAIVLRKSYKLLND